MKTLRELFNLDDDTLIKRIITNSRDATKGDLFVCTMGVNDDRHDYIEDAVKKGISAVVVSQDIKTSIPTIKVENTNLELSNIMKKFCDYKKEDLFIIATTGTNGKTTTAQIIKDLLYDKCAYLGTNGFHYKDIRQITNNTTPDVDKLFPIFKEVVDNGLNTISMEASSEAFFRGRLSSINFNVGVLTNITQDHLNVHKTIENYVDCKCQLFRQITKDGFAVLNKDDKNYEKVLSNCNCRVLTYGKDLASDLIIIDDKLVGKQTLIKLKYEDNIYEFYSNLVGSFNTYNLAAAMLVCLAYGLGIDEVLERVKNVKVVEGRCEFLDFNQDYKIVLDYAHTPDAIEKIISYLNTIKTKRIITLFGSAGGREKEKRPIMGKHILDNSDYVIFTEDDPRDEDPQDIINDLISGSTKTNYEIILPRESAIKRILDLAQENDIILIAGKGRDTYIARKKEYIPYNDYEEIEKYFK